LRCEASLKIALISDIHGNLEALTAALQSIEQNRADRIICLGDVVGYGANPGECLELLGTRASSILLGNHDAAVIGRESLLYFNDFARAAVVWTRSALTQKQKEFIATWPMQVKDRGVQLVHATPKNPENWDYIFSLRDAYDQFASVEGRICFVGHSHVPGDYRDVRRKDSPRGRLELAYASGRRIVNVGSVGQPRDRNARLCYVLYDTETEEVDFVREEYDVAAAAAKIRRAGLPAFLADRLFLGY